MSVIRIEETVHNDRSVEIRADGILDRNSIQILEEVCHPYLREKQKIILNLQGLTYITREGRDYLMDIKNIVIFENIPLFMKLSQF